MNRRLVLYLCCRLDTVVVALLSLSDQQDLRQHGQTPGPHVERPGRGSVSGWVKAEPDQQKGGELVREPSGAAGHQVVGQRGQGVAELGP